MAEPFTLIRVVDTETTGIDDPCEMVEVGWTDVRLFPTGWEIERGPQSVLVNPGMAISFPAMAVHHITDEQAASGISPSQAKQHVRAGADILCAHNSAFDSRFIGTDRPWICTFKAARTAWPDMQSHGNSSIRYERGLCLGDDRSQPSHRAGPDTWVTAHILLDLLKIYQPETLIEMTGRPVTLIKVGFGEHFGKRWSDVPDKYLDWILNKSSMPSDPNREDDVHTARLEVSKRAAKASTSSAPTSAASTHDPDAWRKEMERF